MNTLVTEVVDGKVRKRQYNLHPGQAQAWDCPARFVLVLAGTQGGKTSFGPVWMEREMRRRGPGDYLIATATYDLYKLKLLPEVLSFFKPLGWVYSQSDRILKKGDTRIILRSAQSEGGLESATAKAAWLDECGQEEFSQQAWEAVQRRLSIHQGRALLTTTPYTIGGWLYEVYRRAVGGDPDYGLINFRSCDNPAFPPEEFERARNTLPDWKFRMFYCGEFTRPAGLVYDCYDDVEHTCDAFPIPKQWPRIVGIDFGAQNTATVWLAVDPASEMIFIYRETLMGGLSIYEHARMMLDYNEPVICWFGGAHTEQAQRLDYQIAGIPVAEPPVHDPESQIDRVYALIKHNRIRIFRGLNGLRGELLTYQRELDESGEPTEKIRDKNKYHRLDALRYAACSMPEPKEISAGEEPEKLSDRLEALKEMRQEGMQFSRGEWIMMETSRAGDHYLDDYGL